MGERAGGPRGLFGAGKDCHDFLETSVDPPVADVHGGVGTEKLTNLSEPASVAIGVVAGDEIAN